MPKHRRNIHRRVFAPFITPLLYVLQRNHAWEDIAPGLNVRRIECRNLKRLVQVALSVMGIEKRTSNAKRVSGHNHTFRKQAPQRINVALPHVVGLSDNHEQMRAMESLHVHLIISREPDSESLSVKPPQRNLHHLTAKAYLGVVVSLPNLIPDHEINLT